MKLTAATAVMLLLAGCASAPLSHDQLAAFDGRVTAEAERVCKDSTPGWFERCMELTRKYLVDRAKFEPCYADRFCLDADEHDRWREQEARYRSARRPATAALLDADSVQPH
jgi:hypothetical protein